MGHKCMYLLSPCTYLSPLQMIVAGLFVKELDARFEMDKQYDEQGMFETRYKRRKVHLMFEWV